MYAWISSAAWSNVPGIKWWYRSQVIVTLAWPSAALTVPMLTPAAIAIEANVWRHSPGVIRSSSAALQGWSARR
jgi:hypothetical protein